VSFVLDADIVNYLIKGVQIVRMRYREAVAEGADFVLCPIVHYQVTAFSSSRTRHGFWAAIP
jgi:hypothetical protein